jgi:hypothetical protein
MKKTAITLLGVIIAVIGLHAFRASQSSSITGRFQTDPRGLRIVARQGNDSVKTPLAPDGSFRMTLPTGRWQLEIEGLNHQQRVQKIFIDSMTISEPRDIDLGEIATGL